MQTNTQSNPTIKHPLSALNFPLKILTVLPPKSTGANPISFTYKINNNTYESIYFSFTTVAYIFFGGWFERFGF